MCENELSSDAYFFICSCVTVRILSIFAFFFCLYFARSKNILYDIAFLRNWGFVFT